LCAFLRLLFNPHPTATGLLMHGSFALLAYGVIALFAVELAKNRREILRQLNEIRHQQGLRLDAEEQLRLLAESSPAAIFTLDAQARIVSANRATRELLGLGEHEALAGRSVEACLPVLAEALKLETGADSFRTVAQVQGTRPDGTAFCAQVCFSTYRAGDRSARLAAIAFDSTEDTREREEQSQQQMLESHRIVAGAVAHEVRNVCSAMSVIYANLEPMPGMRESPDFQAMGSLLTGLGRLAHLELQGRDEAHGSADVRDVLNQLRILIAPAWDEEGAEIHWPDLRHPLLVAADSFTLLQTLLNIAKNGLTAVSRVCDKRLAIGIETSGTLARVSFIDSGPGVAEPEILFQPFRSGSGNVGIGLYVSRALMRRYGGDVRYAPGPDGTRFIVEVPLHGTSSDAYSGNEPHSAVISG
jgi:PAS domain S-box-containing protein